MLVREGHTGRGNPPPVRATTQPNATPPSAHARRYGRGLPRAVGGGQADPDSPRNIRYPDQSGDLKATFGAGLVCDARAARQSTLRARDNRFESNGVSLA